MIDYKERLENLSPLKRALLALEEMKKKLDAVQRDQHEPIAIVGMSCRFPKAKNVDEFWKLLKDGVDAIQEVPKNRWDNEIFYDPEPGKPGKIITKYGGFIDDFDQFDPHFFGISPREAAGMDPQQRLLLEVTWESFENANINADTFENSKTGVFIGMCTNDYSLLQSKVNNYSFVDAYSGSGNAFSIAANRLSYLFNFRGPSIAIDTACSSSLVAVHMACKSLRNKETDMAVSGGVGLIMSPEPSIAFSQAHMLAPGGRCRTFDASAEGYVRGEGCGIIVLKRLSDAIKDDNHILAVIHGSAINQDGRTNGLTAPNSIAQKHVIQNALNDAGLSPEDIGYIEAHGTGTILGDPIEIQALSMVMKNRPKENTCYIGSVKTNVGHLEAAAGIAGLIKTVLLLKNKKIPPHLHFKQVNPHISFEETPFVIPTKLQEWQTEEKRVAGVSSFGFGGTNAHIILGEPPPQEIQINSEDRSQHILFLSTKDEESLTQLASEYSEVLNCFPSESLGDLCYTANSCRTDFLNRLAVTFSSKDELQDQLKTYINGENHLFRVGNVNENIDIKTAFLFTGQGAQYPGMGKVLYQTFSFYREIIDECADLLNPILNTSILDIIFAEGDNEDLIHRTEFTQPSLFVIEYALAKLWLSWGIKPQYLLGHSVGEYVAATIADVFSLEDGLQLIAARGRLMQSLPENGSMIVLFTNYEIAQHVVEPFQSSVSIAGINGPHNIVVSGEKESIKQIINTCEIKGIEYRELTVSHAFHSPLMEPILDEFESIAQTIDYREPKIPIVSNLTGELLPYQFVPDASYWTKHIREGVQFYKGMQTLDQHKCNFYLEIGPNPTLTGMGRRILPESKAVWIPSLKKDKDDLSIISDSIANFYVNGLKIDWQNFDKDFKRNKIQLPNYPFQRERYWLDWIPEISASPENFDPSKITEHVETRSERRQKTEKPVLNWEQLALLEPNELKETLKKYVLAELSKALRIPEDRFDPKRSITSYGLDSIMAIELKNSLESILNVQISIAFFIKGPNIEELLDLMVEQFHKAKPKKSAISLDSAGQFPTSNGQKAMWWQHQLSPSSIFNQVYAVRIPLELDIKKLRESIHCLVNRHPSLRTNFKYSNEVPVQVVHENVDSILLEVDVSNWSEHQLKDRIEKESVKPFDLENEPLIRIILFKKSREEQILLLVCHHIISDMWSLAVFMYELNQLYSSDEKIDLPALDYSYLDYVNEQIEMLKSEAGESHLNYWKDQLSGELPILNIPTDSKRPVIQSYSGKTESFTINSSTCDRLKHICEKNDATLYALLLAAINVLFHRYTGQNDIILGSPMSGRTNTDYSSIFGYFVNPVAIRTKINGSESFISLLQQVKQTALGALEHQDYPFNLLVEKLQPKRDPSRTPIFQHMFVYQKAYLMHETGMSGMAVAEEGGTMKLGDMTLESIPIENRVVPFDMTIIMAELEAGLGVSLQYNSDIFSQATIVRFLNHFNNLLTNISKNPDETISSYSILSNDELEQYILNWNQTFQALPASLCLLEFFEQRVEKSPDKVAVVFDNKQLTYEELNQKSNQLAWKLKELGIGPDVIVGISSNRSLDMIIGILAILKAGGAYLPLDPTYPKERISFMFQDSNIKLLLTHKSLEAKLPDNSVNRFYFDSLDEGNGRLENPECLVNPQNLAYIIYTSGSTGNPKGVMVTHAGLTNLSFAQIKDFSINSETRLLQFASLSFDAAASEIFTTLIAGATLFLVEKDILLSGPELIEFIQKNKITTTTFPPSVLRILPPESVNSLKTVVSAGEACTDDIAKLWSKGKNFINAYGPTETTICATSFHVNDEIENQNVPIGKPIDNVQTHVLDQYMNIVPLGVPGELHIGGAGVARGYLMRPDLTAEKFIPDPFTKSEGARLYKSGDLVRRLPSGDIEFLDRIDQQVKLRGFRIELGEIEVIIKSLESVKDVVTTAAEDRLTAYVIPDNSKQLNLEEIKFELRKKLPEYMIPSSFVELTEFPLTENGKIDYKSLPSPIKKSQELTEAETDVERKLVRIWCEILNIDHVGIHDNFFDLGGHSLAIIKAQNKIKDVFDREIDVVDMFKYPTVGTFAKYLDNGSNGSDTVKKSRNRASRQREATLLQQRRAMNRRK